MYLSDALRLLGACPDSVAWARGRRFAPGGLAATYREAPLDWICWLIDRTVPHREKGPLMAELVAIVGEPTHRCGQAYRCADPEDLAPIRDAIYRHVPLEMLVAHTRRMANARRTSEVYRALDRRARG